MKQILITGGPVHAYLDDVKIITNRFKGGLMAKLAGQFVKQSEQSMEQIDDRFKVIYICSKNAQQPWWDEFLGGDATQHLACVHHNGINDYMNKVLALAPQVKAVVLGAAVANLIPKNKIEGKFPSHNYKVGDTIPIDFTIAPRIIDEVKKVNPKVHLFGFKLLSGADHDELIRAAYGVLLESKATTIFANDATDLNTIYAVCKDRSVHKMTREDIMGWIQDRLEEKYYSTTKSLNVPIGCAKETKKVYELIKENEDKFVITPEGYIFGSVAVRIGDGSFVTTIRGKNELTGTAVVEEVNYLDRVVTVGKYDDKASLNAPLFGHIFLNNKEVDHILHFHQEEAYISTQEYALPGTDKDSVRDLKSLSFNIENHGCILSYDKEGNILV